LFRQRGSIARSYSDPSNKVLAPSRRKGDGRNEDEYGRLPKFGGAEGRRHERLAGVGSSRTFAFWRVRSVFSFGMVCMKPNASATWIGDLRRGKGVLTTGSGTLSQSQYFGTGDGEAEGPNPYELVAAAHAACFSMTLANELAGSGLTPQRIVTTVMVTLEPLPAGWTVTGIQLDVLAEVPRLKQNDFIRAAVRAKTNCTISRLLKTNLSMSAKLDNSENRRPAKVRPPTDSLKVLKTKKQSIGHSSPKV
jgi:osmotically inducible protein OsmC